MEHVLSNTLIIILLEFLSVYHLGPVHQVSCTGSWIIVVMEFENWINGS